MLKKRLVAVLVIKRGIVVQSMGFRRYLPVGRPEIAVEFLNQWGIDEIVLLDIDATREGRTIGLDLVGAASRRGFVPLTVGGGLRSVDDMKRVLQSGADKIAINEAAWADPELIARAAETFGRQCVVVSIDAKPSRGGHEVFRCSGQIGTGQDPAAFARRCVALGAGELLVNAIDRDGARGGYDLRLGRAVTDAVDVPVILCGGVGRPSHLSEGLAIEKLSAVAAANFFHHTEHSVAVAKAYLERDASHGIRLESYASYRGATFDAAERVGRKSDHELGELLFEYHPKEVI